MKENFKKLNLKRKVFSRGGRRNFKKFKRLPKFVRDNPENQVAREKERDAYHFTDSDDESDDLGMGIDISDLPFLDDNMANKQKDLIALTQDSVCPFFSSEGVYDESKLDEGLAELKLTSFRPNQKETVKRILFGRSTLFISPTGSGKSLCYQLPALLYWRYRKYITIVVSPLISLMEDQMTNFPTCLKPVSIHSGHNRAQRSRSIEQLVQGEAQVVFISPEAIVGGLLELDDLKNLPPVGFVCIDEAHCLSEWSHNFRPAYLQFFQILRGQMNIKTYLGLTATATKATSFAISRSLTINPETDVIGSTKVPDNLILSVSYVIDKQNELINILKSDTFRILPSIIVYCNRREETERVASTIRTAMQNYSTLIEIPERVKKASDQASPSESDSVYNSSPDKPHTKLTWHAEAYHAGMTIDARKKIQRRFVKGEIRVVVATIAFGMGINKSNVRAIIHYDMPSSFESYVQEIGRAGRDGKPAQCHMLLKADKTDLYYQQRNIYASITERKNLRRLTELLFRPCRCKTISSKEESEKLDKLNQADQHEIISKHRTSFIETPIESVDDEDLEAFQLLAENNNSTSNVKKENRPIRFIKKSIVKKHRHCIGHEISFPVEEAINEVNLKPESIMTLIHQLNQAYPQLKIQQYPPAKSTCNLFCYHGPSQMKTLSETSKPVGYAMTLHRKEQMMKNGSAGEIPQKIAFDVIKVASMMAKPSAEVKRMLKKHEWELVEKTGRFRRTQVRVSFGGNSFHLSTIGDLTEAELDEINLFLNDHTKSYEKAERDRISRVFDTLQRFSIDLKQMGDKKVRLETSSKLKAALDQYFDMPLDSQQVDETPDQVEETSCFSADDFRKRANLQEQLMRRNASAFISMNGTNFTPRAIARIFQGISTPNYPAENWGTNRRWWRIHLDVDFLKLTSVIEEELLSRVTQKVT